VQQPGQRPDAGAQRAARLPAAAGADLLPRSPGSLGRSAGLVSQTGIDGLLRTAGQSRHGVTATVDKMGLQRELTRMRMVAGPLLRIALPARGIEKIRARYWHVATVWRECRRLLAVAQAGRERASVVRFAWLLLLVRRGDA